jgi:ferritin-like metal-binding protein YciE
MQMQLFSQTIAETSNQAIQLRQLFKETQKLPSVACLTDEDIANEIEQVRNGL